MKLLKSSLIIFSSIGLFFLTACNSGNQASNSNTSPAASSPEASKSVTPMTETSQSSEPATSKAETAKTKSDGESQGGQVAEVGIYHLEFVPEKEENGTHLDFYLQKGDTHEAVPNANITAQVQSPDGKQQSLNLTYDAEGKHYAVLFPGTTTGQYQVKIAADVSGENVNGRFSFQQ